MTDLVGENQSAFIAGRQMIDGPLIANKVISWLRKSKKPGVFLKIDFQKAYDMIDWHFLDAVMKQLGFG